jgi:hypothetical protein
LYTHHVIIVMKCLARVMWEEYINITILFAYIVWVWFYFFCTWRIGSFWRAHN